MTKLTTWATGRNIVLLLLLFLLFKLVIIPAVYPKFETLDTLWSYTPDEAYLHISSYGDKGRQAYMIVELTLDLVYPFISALLFSLAILYSFKHGFPDYPGTVKLALLPLGVMLADYLENASIVIMLASHPVRLAGIAAASNVFTVTKFLLPPLELVFIVGLSAWLVRSIHNRSLLRADHE